MGTQSNVGVLTVDNTFRAVEVHYDGYASPMPVALATLIDRYGIATVSSTLIDECKGGWNSISPDRKHPEQDHLDIIPGYGSVYSEVAEDEEVVYTGTFIEACEDTANRHMLVMPKSHRTFTYLIDPQRNVLHYSEPYSGDPGDLVSGSLDLSPPPRPSGGSRDTARSSARPTAAPG